MIFLSFLWIRSDISSTESQLDSDYSSSNNLNNPRDFHGDPCTEDCSGHEAGYEWASEKGITDPYDCDGNSNSFIEGCRAYAEEN